MNWKEFRPSLYFLAKFLAVYLLGNLVYGLFITSYYPLPDPVTAWVTEQSSGILNLVGYETVTQVMVNKPNILVLLDGRSIIAVYEGCNGLNVVIVFMSFLVAFGPWKLRTFWFACGGLVVIHLANLLRVTVLFVIALRFPDQLYFLHKYFFTAFLYLVVFIMWYLWADKMKFRREGSK